MRCSLVVLSITTVLNVQYISALSGISSRNDYIKGQLKNKQWSRNQFTPGPTRPAICPEIIGRTRWGARTPLEIDYTIIPVKNVIIHHTVTPECTTEAECTDLLTSIQTFHMDDLEFYDIGYNFLVGGDGRIYEGAGWHKVGAHTRGFNTRSIGLAFIGNFTDKLPNEKQLKAAKNFIECGIELGELDGRVNVFGARQVSSTKSPGLKLYHHIQSWPHFARNPK